MSAVGPINEVQMSERVESIGTVASCWRYPVKSMQGSSVDSLEVGTAGVAGDRTFALLDKATGKVLSAKRVGSLLQATATATTIGLPDGTNLEIGSSEVDSTEIDAALSAWLDRDVTLLRAEGTSGLGYEMTFDPPDDTSEYYEIPMPAGTFVDLAPLHLVASATLEGCRRARPDLDWDVRRFRPNMVLDVAGEPFVEDSWVGRNLRIGSSLICSIDSATVRCAMPLRAQPALPGEGDALGRQPELFHAMNELHAAAPNHLGVYVGVVVPGRVAVGDRVELLDAEPAALPG